MSRGMRIFALTGGLMATGAIMGAVCAMIALAVVFVSRGATPDLFSLEMRVGAAVGAGIGAVGAPLVAFVLLRQAPLGRALLETALGAILGGIAGAFIPVVNPVYGAIAGFLLAALFLRVRTGRRSKSRAPVDASVD
jgi:hypothetical protein